MGRSSAVPLLLFVLLPGFAQTKKGQPASVTVSAGIPKDQLKNEEACKAKVEQAKRALADDPGKAVALLQEAFAIAEKHDYLKFKAAEIQNHLGSAYAAQGKSAEATDAFMRSLQLYGEPCAQTGSRDLAACAEIQLNQGFGKWVDKDFESALVLARSARADLRRQQEVDQSDLPVAAHKIKEAEALLFESSVLATAGRADTARARIGDAIVLIKEVLAADLPSDTRRNAEKIFEFAKELSEAIGSAAIR